MPIRDDLAAALAGALAAVGVEPPAGPVHLERPARREHGDWSSNVALASAKAAGRNPRELATELVEQLTANPPAHVASVEIAGPGFVNFRLQPTWLEDVLRDVVAGGTERYASSATGGGERVMIEFVSANPTGPVHVGNGWFASYGDALGRVMSRAGYAVSREYYVNDTGGQIRKLGASILARHRGEPVPEDGYPGEYVADLAASYDGPDDVTEAGRWAAERVLDGIKATMESIHIHYDEWFSQASIEDSSAVADTIALLDAKGVIYEEDGALWINTADHGDPREKRVLRKSNGDYTYIAGDIAYHYNKFVVRGFDRVINVWGSDHQSQVGSLKAAIEILGVDRDRLECRLGQMVSLAGARMSKRAGNVIDLDELVGDIGPDATRLLSLLTSIDQPVTIDLDKVRSETKESPVYYVQYAHTRIASIGRVAAERGVERMPLAEVDLGLLVHDREGEVLRSLEELPDVMAMACADRAPHKVATWVRELADRFHGFYHDCYVMGDGVSPELTQARLWLVEAARIGFAIGLDVLGVSAPESM
jgi:arginyl-tRNA synthetase